MNHFQKYGRSLLANGYLIIPIRKGEKRPAISAWQKARLGAGDLSHWPGHGVGVLCGQGAHPVIGVDIDVSHPTIGPALIEWCQVHLGMAPERVGAAPRVCLVYRADRPGWAKGHTAQFFDPTDPLKPNGKTPNHQQVEILGQGQQFVAYHEHPDTGRDYEWVDLLGGLEYVNAADLSVVTEAQIDALLAEFMRLVRITPGVEMVGTADSPICRSTSDDDDLMALSTRTGVAFEEVEQRMALLPNDDSDYDTWLHVGQALHHEFSGTPHEDGALTLWREWGSRSSKDDPKQYGFKWRSFGKTSGSQLTLRWLLKMTRIAKQDAEAEDKLGKLAAIRELIAGQESSIGLGEAAARIKELMPDDAMLRTEILGAYQSAFKKLSGTNLPVAQARTLLLGPRMATVQAKRPLTEFGNAERMLDRYSEGLMYVPETDEWYSWTGVYWRKASIVEIEHLAKETIRALPTEEHADPAEFFMFCAISQQAKMVKNMIQLAHSDPRVMVPAKELDKHAHLLGVQNGVVDLRNGKLLSANPEYRITLSMACDYNPAATCSLFERTVMQVFSDDQQMADYFLLTLGYTLMGRPKEDIMFIPFGNGANGKSTVLGAVRRVFGSYARSAEATSFVKDGAGASAGGPREDLVRLRGSRFVYVNEPDENGELREGAVKSMTGGDAITARGIHAKASVEVEPSWVVYMPTNHKPIIKGGDNGIWRRLGLLPFDRNFENDPSIKKDPDLAEKLVQEIEGVLALLVRQALLYQRSGLVPPARVKAARDDYRGQMDILGEWLDECCELGAYEVEASRLWLSWELFAKNRGLGQYVRSSIALGRRLDSRFSLVRGNRGVRMRQGLRLKAESVTSVTSEDLF